MMTKKKRWIALFLVFVVFASFLTGCKGRESGLIDNLFEKKEKEEPKYNKVKTELSAVPLERDELYQGFFILHDGKYYQASGSSWCSNDDFAEDLYDDNPRLNTSHVIAFDKDYDLLIPTLYLESGDKLVYYSDSSILDFVYFMRYKDCGYSVPLANIKATKGGYLYIPIDKEGIESGDVKSPILESEISEELLNVYGKETPDDSVYQIRLDTINEQRLTSDWLTDFGIIRGCEKNKEYTFNAEVGSLNYNFAAKAEYHYLQEYELYGEAAYETLFDNTYEIPIPSHLKTGYYMLTNGCVFRLVREGKSYNMYDSDFFNEQQLYFVAEGEEKPASTGLYSTNPELNTYTSNVPGTLGYVEEDVYMAEEETSDTEITPLENAVKKYCSLTVKEDFTVEEDTPLYTFTSKPDATLNTVTPPKQYQQGTSSYAQAEMEDDGFTFTSTLSEGTEYKKGDVLYLEVSYVGAIPYTMTYVDKHFKVTELSELPEEALNAGSESRR